MWKIWPREVSPHWLHLSKPFSAQPQVASSGLQNFVVNQNLDGHSGSLVFLKTKSSFFPKKKNCLLKTLKETSEQTDPTDTIHEILKHKPGITQKCFRRAAVLHRFPFECFRQRRKSDLE